MSSRVRVPVSVQVEKKRYGTLRSVHIDDTDIPKDTADTQEWGLAKVRIKGSVRDELNIDEISEDQVVGYASVDIETLEWDFTTD